MEVLDEVFYGNTLKSWGISLIILVSALVLNKLIVVINKHFFKKITEKSANRYTGILINSVISPLLLGIMLLAIWIAAIRLHWEDTIYVIISKAYNILIVLNVTWLIVRLVAALLDEQARKSAEKCMAANLPVDNRLMPLIKRTVLMVIWAVGVVTALNNVGISVATLLGALGIGGIAIALAAQDTVKNIIGGVTLFTDRPFRIGDNIRFDAINGKVEDIGIRSTKIRMANKHIITIPNSKIVDAAIEKIDDSIMEEAPLHKVEIQLALPYNTSVEKIDEAIALLKAIPQTVKEVEPTTVSANLSLLGDAALQITCVYFVQKSAADNAVVISNVNFEILNRFKQAGLKFANQI